MFLSPILLIPLCPLIDVPDSLMQELIPIKALNCLADVKFLNPPETTISSMADLVLIRESSAAR